MEHNEEKLENQENLVNDTVIVENVEEAKKEMLKDQEPQETSKEDLDKEGDELDVLKKHKEENKKLKEELEVLNDRLLRLTAEYENYRKRTTKEKQGIYGDASVEVLKEVVPILDNLERAVGAEGSVEDLKKGVEMTIKACKDSFEKLGVEEIDASSEFNPNFHQAVMHVEDEKLGTNQIVEIFLKGYKKEDKIIRYTVVKVAN